MRAVPFASSSITWSCQILSYRVRGLVMVAKLQRGLVRLRLLGLKLERWDARPAPAMTVFPPLSQAVIRRAATRRKKLLRRLVGAACGLMGVILPLGDARRLAAAAAQIIELGAANLAAAHHLDRVDHRRIQRKHALDALAVRNLAHGEVLVEARAGAADADALVGLHAGALAFDDLDVDHDSIARLKFGNFLAGAKSR